MIKKAIEIHPIPTKTCNFHENHENRRVLGVYEKAWIFHENLRNPRIRINFADGVPGKWSKESPRFIQSQRKLVISVKIMKIDVSLAFTKKRGFFTKIFQICGFASLRDSSRAWHLRGWAHTHPTSAAWLSQRRAVLFVCVCVCVCWVGVCPPITTRQVNQTELRWYFSSKRARPIAGIKFYPSGK